MSSSIGAILKEARSRKAITLEEIHTKIKIHPRVIQLLEEDHFEKLPSPLFARSFLKSYAEFLQLNSQELLAHLESMKHKDPEQVLFIRPPDAARRRVIAVDSRWFAATAVVLAALIFGGLVFYSGKLVVTGMSAMRLKAAKAPKKAATRPGEKPGSDMLRSPSLGNFPELNRRDPLELKVKALEDVWIRITCDGKVLYQAVLKRGRSEAWKASSRVEIWTGNSSNMYLSVNNHAIGSPARGVIKKMVITHDGISIAK